MRKNSKGKITLGVFVTVGILLFIIAVYYIGKKQQLFSDTFRLSAIFKDIKGLQVGNDVRFSGINVGVVEDIQIASDSTVRLDMMINEETRKFIKKNAKATIGTDGLMGNKILIILPGLREERMVENDNFIETVMPVSIDDILAKLKVTGDHAADITGNLASIMDNIRAGKGTVGKLFMDSVFATNLDRTVVNLKQGAGGFSQNMEAAKHSFLLRGLFKDKKSRKEKREERRKLREEKKDKK